MDEQEWLTGRPQPMFAVLNRLYKRLGRPIPNRKLRFFAYHCCRLAWPTMRDERSRNAVEIGERSLVGGCADEDLAEAVRRAQLACDEAYAVASGPFVREEYNAAQGAAIALRALVHGHTQSSIAKVRDALFFGGCISGKADLELLLTGMSRALHEIFGNPFRPVGFDPAWLTSDVTLLAQGIYEDRAFDRMPILADALQDAGCEDEQILAHCRDAALTHVRGCWVVDLILGKE